MSRLIWVMVALWTLLLAVESAAAASPPATQPAAPNRTMNLKPSPNYTPRMVVQFQLEALGHNDDPAPDTGIAVAFRFASPSNQSQTGPLDKFIHMIKSPAYAAMVNHQSVEYGEVHSDGQQAQQLVKITGAGGDMALYLFILSRQTDGQFKNCWMTDGVMRIHPEDIVPVPPPDGGNNGDGNGAGNGDGHDRA